MLLCSPSTLKRLLSLPQKSLSSGKQTLLGLQWKDVYTLFKFLQWSSCITGYSFTQHWLKVKHFLYIPVLVRALIQKIIELNSRTFLTKEGVDSNSLPLNFYPLPVSNYSDSSVHRNQWVYHAPPSKDITHCNSCNL